MSTEPQQVGDEPVKTSKEQSTSVPDDASVAGFLSSWDGVISDIKTSLSAHSALIASDFRLSLKAILVTLICGLLLVSLITVVWVSLLVGMVYGLMLLGVEWFWCLLLTVVINILVLVMIKRLLSAALKSVGMKATSEIVFNSNSENP